MIYSRGCWHHGDRGVMPAFLTTTNNKEIRTMPKIGISISVDVTKIDKSRIYVGEKGKYLKLTAWVDTTEEDQYGNHGMITQETSKEEREDGLKLPILGNAKVFYNLERTADTPAPTPPPFPSEQQEDDVIDDLPF